MRTEPQLSLVLPMGAKAGPRCRHPLGRRGCCPTWQCQPLVIAVLVWLLRLARPCRVSGWSNLLLER
eukprot:790543-Lingulodinium_polyedra.AAC.1